MGAVIGHHYRAPSHPAVDLVFLHLMNDVVHVQMALPVVRGYLRVLRAQGERLFQGYGSLRVHVRQWLPGV